MKSIPRDLQTLLETGAVGNLPDGQLLGRFVARHDEAAFGALVQRHGPMVWGVCLRVLRDSHDAEDAFQATFLVLARKAATIAHREALAGWLYGVAQRTARKARTLRTRRRNWEAEARDRPQPGSSPQALGDDLLPLLDQELGRLTDKYRLPVVLCDLQGKTHREAADALGWPIGTVSGRLSRARAMLARRLARHGLAVTGGSLGLVLSEQAPASPPALLLRATVRSATRLAAGRLDLTGGASAAVLSLTQGAMNTMLLSKLGWTACGMVLALALSAGLARALSTTAPGSQGPEPEQAGNADGPGSGKAPVRKTRREQIEKA